MPTPTRSLSCSPKRNVSVDRPRRLKDWLTYIARSSKPVPCRERCCPNSANEHGGARNRSSGGRL